jgi:hypothetical protein
MSYVLIEEDLGVIVKISGPGTFEQLRALLPDNLMKCETNNSDCHCWATESCETSYVIMLLTPIH